MPSSRYHEDVALIEFVKEGAMPRLIIELKLTVHADLLRLDVTSLKETLLYASYFMRKYNSQRIVAALTDMYHWYIFDCSVEDEYKLKLCKYNDRPQNI